DRAREPTETRQSLRADRQRAARPAPSGREKQSLFATPARRVLRVQWRAVGGRSPGFCRTEKAATSEPPVVVAACPDDFRPASPGRERRERVVARADLDAVAVVPYRRQRVVPVAVERLRTAVDGERLAGGEAAALALEQARRRLEAGRARAEVARLEV